MKDLLAETMGKDCPFLPKTYNLENELAEFIIEFYDRQQKGHDNVWIIKPWYYLPPSSFEFFNCKSSV